MEAIVVVLGMLAALLLLMLVWLIVNFNRMTRVRQHIKESWSDIDVEMKRRYELIPNLVETVQGYAAHEQAVLEEVTQLRRRAMQNHDSPASQAVDESALLLATRKLFAVAEAYPQLRSDAHFLALQQQLANTEDRIAAARRFYNANVREMKQLCQQFPTNLIAQSFGFSAGDYFQLDSAAERVVPRVGL